MGDPGFVSGDFSDLRPEFCFAVNLRRCLQIAPVSRTKGEKDLAALRPRRRKSATRACRTALDAVKFRLNGSLV
jgi:hypothetical protein